MEQSNPLAVHRDVDVLELRADAALDVDPEGVEAVGRKVVLADDAAARAVRRAVEMIPWVLRDEWRRTIRGDGGRGLAIADRHACDGARRVEIPVEQRRGERLGVGDVVEVRALGVEREEVRGIDVDPEQVVHDSLVLRAVEALESARPGVRRGGRPVDDVFHRLDEQHQCVAGGAACARGRHDVRAQFADHLLGRLEVRRRRFDREVVQRQISLHRLRVVAGAAVTLYDRRHLGGRGKAARRKVARTGDSKRMPRSSRIDGTDARGVTTGRERKRGRCNSH